IAGGQARSRGRLLGSLTFERAWPQRPYVLALPQSRTETLLAERLAALAPAALHRGVEVVGLDADGGDISVTARPAAGSCPDGDAGPARWRARLVIGADGSRSRVRDLAGIRTALPTYPDTYLMGDVADSGSRRGARIQLEPGGAVEAFPLAGAARRWVTSTAPDRYLRGDGAASGSRRGARLRLEPGGVSEAFPLPGAMRRWVAHTGTARLGTGRFGKSRSARTPEELAAIVRRRTGERIDP